MLPDTLPCCRSVCHFFRSLFNFLGDVNEPSMILSLTGIAIGALAIPRNVSTFPSASLLFPQPEYESFLGD